MKKKTTFILLFSIVAIFILSVIVIKSVTTKNGKVNRNHIMEQASSISRGEDHGAREIKDIINGLSVLAENGDTDAQIMLGIIYVGTKNSLPDINKAIYWFQKAADSGNPVGQMALGEYYLNSDDVAKGVMLVKTAAEAGYAPAQMLYGDLFFEGRGCDVDYQKAYTWYTTAIERIPYYEVILPDLERSVIKKTLEERAKKAFGMLTETNR